MTFDLQISEKPFEYQLKYKICETFQCEFTKIVIIL